MDEYEVPVHKSLMKYDLLLGISKTMFIIIMCVTVCMMYIFSPWCFLLGVVFYIPVRLITNQDPALFDILLESLFEPDHLEG